MFSDFFGQGVARSLLLEVIRVAEDKALPIRLVSSAQNLDSFSLYTRQGFSPIHAFQDMFLEIPEDGLKIEVSSDHEVLDATFRIFRKW